MSTDYLSPDFMSPDAERFRPLAVYTDMEDIDYSAGVALLEENGYDVRYLGSQDPTVIMEQAKDAEALLVGYASVTAGIMDAIPNLKIIALVSMGYDNVDLDAAKERGIWVSNLPGVATEEVASHALALALAVTREIPFFQGRVAEGDWNGRPETTVFRLSQERLGLIGLGRIGSRFGKLASGVFGEVIGYDPYLPDTPATRDMLAKAGIRRAGLDEVLAESAVVSLHMPLTEETRHIINVESLAAMRPGSYLVNVSRGQLIDDGALRAAIDSGHIRAAALDVLDVEPAPADHPLMGHPRILVTPHIGFLSDHTLAEYIRIQAQNVISQARTGAPDTPLFELEPAG
ncbi:phosphoglycerate dehydrogenase-like enzyme [Arthrobacter sp. V4I6]|uniref:C-terminal binding protein n=1 Tax=unclassified Arthrobacter TaxID=235627 RepID=UPI0027854487|nr:MULTISPECIES: C-terminal binding protein [unclassified Arthrobacter]MDQ0819532.1 phosphoglycerate dehydrogenase-like enzyme [Arthrobacter sp. V1I7]MDQ0853714.1 phosphoglycerate dehydrogenase-like enzyme [Arthrobacter sp. V4I6]